MEQLAEGNKGFCFKEFGNLDTSPDADYLITSMDVMFSLNSIQAIKQRAIAAMRLKPGDSVVELGCGHGEDAETIGQLVGYTGSVVAVDLSQRMIAEAKRRSRQVNVKYLVADASRLAYSDKTFSACHADRLLVSHSDYQALFKEAVRVVKPGGIVCFTDVDALSIALHPYTHTTRIILNQLHRSFVNPYIGRMLPELFVRSGLKDITVIPESSMIRSFATLNKIFQFSRVAKEAMEQGQLTQKAFRQWEKDIHKAEDEGYFMYCITLFTVAGRVPL